MGDHFEDPELAAIGEELYNACKSNDVEKATIIVASHPVAIHYQNAQEDNRTPLHAAASQSSTQLIRLLLDAGAQWNVVDKNAVSAGELASGDAYEMMVQEGMRTEFVLNLLERKNAVQDEPEDADTEESAPASTQASNASYLSSSLRYTEDGARLLDAEDNGVMMGWEAPLMAAHVEHFREHFKLMRPLPTECEESGAGPTVLNVGFGLGIIDLMLQERVKPSVHVIIEAHPDVVRRMKETGWAEKKGVVILEGRWQEVVEDGRLAEATPDGGFDFIYFDTFGEYYADLREFNDLVPNYLSQEGLYSFFNGLSGTNSFFHDVYCRIAEGDLLEGGLETRWVDLDLTTPDQEVWKGIRRAYWTLPVYHIPLCTFAL
ncbi:S-adenosyl-L-methionine-dependent methyltransferase [Cladochytrium replicatum]|nr:S-adenosyl-L-methionine-dependent methyltransferase [Cladochytrium replicatum]